MSPSPNNSLCFQTKGISKDYTVRVLDCIDFDLNRGEVHGLLGANGAGKSTFCRIVAGLTSASAGTMHSEGKVYSPATKQEAEEFGVQIVQQELTLIPTLSVAENLFLNRMPHRLGIINRRRLQHAASIALARVGLEDVPPDTPAGSLGIGQQQLIEIANAIDRQCRVLIFDEPTAMLTYTESQRLFQLIHELKERGIGIIYISHRLKEVAEITDRISILRDGKKVGTYATADVTTDRMVQIMSGDPAETFSSSAANETPNSVYSATKQKSRSTAQIAMAVDNFSRANKFQNISFQVSRGEVLGISGLIGSGRTELLRAIFGADDADEGNVTLFDDPANPTQPTFSGRFQSPTQSVAHGIAMVTEDRKDNGLLLSQSIKTNLTLSGISNVANTLGIVNRTTEEKASTQLIDQLHIRCQGTDQHVGTLSGGNQQKVAIGKWLFKDASVFLLDEPTRGIDMAARQRIYRLIEELSGLGKTIVMVSSDIEELLQTCDRIGVMSGGKWIRTYERHEFDAESITDTAFASFK